MSNKENILQQIKKKLICKALDYLLLNNNGSYFSFTNFHDQKIPLDIKKYTFIGK